MNTATYYYNPKVYTPKTALQDVRRVEPRWAALYEKDPERICESREAALQHTFEGPILFRENGVLMEALLVPDWCYSPIDDNRVWTQSGINWYTDYATDKRRWQITTSQRTSTVKYRTTEKMR